MMKNKNMTFREMLPGFVAVLLIAAVCVLPLPRRVDAALEGARLSGGASDSASEETVELEVHGWYLTYLFRTNTLKATLTVTPCSLEGEESLSFQFSAPVYSHDGVSRAALDRYSASVNSYVTGNLYFSKDFDELAYTDDLDSDGIYAASGYENADYTAVAQSLNAAD